MGSGWKIYFIRLTDLPTSLWRFRDFLVAQTVKNLPAMQETRVRSLGRKDPLEKGMTIHSSILAWRIPWTEDPGWLQSMGLQRVGHDWVTNTFNLFYEVSLCCWEKVVSSEVLEVRGAKRRDGASVSYCFCYTDIKRHPCLCTASYTWCQDGVL